MVEESHIHKDWIMQCYPGEESHYHAQQKFLRDQIPKISSCSMSKDCVIPYNDLSPENKGAVKTSGKKKKKYKIHYIPVHF